MAQKFKSLSARIDEERKQRFRPSFSPPQPPPSAQKRTLARRLRRTESLRAALAVVRQTPDIFASVQAMMQRKDELLFPTKLSETDSSRAFAAMLAGIASNARGRALLELAIDRAAKRDSDSLKQPGLLYCNELVIGAGTHAAVYSAAQQSFNDASPPLVIDRRQRSGGIFALARRPVFYLNSRNRPESVLESALPGRRGALNSIRNAPIQPSDFSSEEYPSQDEQAFVARINLALYARLMLGVEVESIERSGEGYKYCVKLRDVDTDASYTVFTKRIIVATGCGEPKKTVRGRRSPRIMTFDQFVERMGNTTDPFPLKDFRKVAVVGANDSGRVVVEYLLGQGPQSGMSGTGLDFPQIMWFGQQSATKERFEQCERSRYAGIGRYLPRSRRESFYRITPVQGRVLQTRPLKGSVFVEWNPRSNPRTTRRDQFDHVILATGYENQVEKLLKNIGIGSPYFAGALEPVAKQVGGEEIYIVGPAAELPISAGERQQTPVLNELPDNSVAIFRYASRTRDLALALGKADNNFTIQFPEYIKTTFQIQSPPTAVQRASMTMPVSAPEPMPEGIVTEDVVKALAHEMFGGRRAPRGVTQMRISVQENVGIYRCEMDADGPVITEERLRRMMTDPDMQTVLARFIANNRKGRAEISIPFKRGRVDLKRVQMV